MTMPARLLVFIVAGLLTAQAEIPRPADAPRPLSPAEAVNSFHLPPGYTMKLVASEPLIHEPSGVCWDEHGRMFVCELHGYNVEGQYDIEELNQKAQAIGQALYAESQAAEAGDGFTEAAQAGMPSEDDVVDAEIVDEDENK